jgi:predicted MFS family arabinose efflux permease
MEGIIHKPVPNKINRKIVGYVLLTFLGYVNIGLPLAILPIFITKTLGFNAIIAGVIISLQYLTTFSMRGYSGKIVDKKGPKPATLISMTCFMLSGVLLFVANETSFSPLLCLSVLVVTRLIAGCGEGMIGASPINWAMLEVGEQHTGTAISFNGIACYGGMAVGAPLGVFLQKYVGIDGVGGLIVCLSLIGFILSKRKKALKSLATENHQPFFKVLKKVLPYGICLALGGIGFGSISSFITLYFDYMHWSNSEFSLTVFGITFIFARLIFSNSIKIRGGVAVCIACFITEIIGLALISVPVSVWFAAIGAAITGLGFSLVFPALGVEAVKLFSSSNKGSALAAYGLFIDISLGITGPLVGLVAESVGMKWIFPFSMFVVVIALGLILFLKQKLKPVSIIAD